MTIISDKYLEIGIFKGRCTNAAALLKKTRDYVEWGNLENLKGIIN